MGGMGEGDLSVVLQGRLPEPHYREWANLVKTDVRLLRSFIAANNGNLQPLDDAIAIAIAGMRGRTRDDTPTTVKEVPGRRRLRCRAAALRGLHKTPAL